MRIDQFILQTKVYSCMYDFVQEYPDSPLSVRLIAESSDCSEQEIKTIFRELRERKLLKRNGMLKHVYTLTHEGLQVVKEGWEDYNRFKQHEDDKNNRQNNVAS